MSEDLSSLSVEQLKEILEKERKEKQRLSAEVAALEKAVQEFGRANERQEEGLMSSFTKQLKKLRADNSVMAVRIEREDEYVKTTLKDKYQAILMEKEALENTLEKDHNRVNNQLQNKLEALNKENENLEAILDVPDKVEEKLKELVESYKTMNESYHNEAAKLRKEVNDLLSSNNALIQRIGAIELEIMTEPDKSAAANGTRETPEMKMRRYSTMPTNPMNQRRRY